MTNSKARSGQRWPYTAMRPPGPYNADDATGPAPVAAYREDDRRAVR